MSSSSKRSEDAEQGHKDNSHTVTEPAAQTVGSMVDAESLFDGQRVPRDHAQTESDSKHQSNEQETQDPAAVYVPSTCSECGSTHVVEHEKHAEVRCEECGEIVETRKFPQTYGRNRFVFTMDERSTRVTSDGESGIELDGLGGRIDYRDKDGYGNTLTSMRRAQLHRLRQFDRASDTDDPRKQMNRYATSEINRMASLLSIPDYVRDGAREMFQTILSNDELSGMSVEAAATACLYHACTEGDINRAFNEIVELSHADETEVHSVTSDVGVLADVVGYGGSVTEHIDAFVNPLGLDDDTVWNVEKLLKLVLSPELIDMYDLRAITAGAVYAALLKTRQYPSIARVASIAGRDINDVREGYQLILEAAE